MVRTLIFTSFSYGNKQPLGSLRTLCKVLLGSSYSF